MEPFKEVCNQTEWARSSSRREMWPKLPIKPHKRQVFHIKLFKRDVQSKMCVFIHQHAGELLPFLKKMRYPESETPPSNHRAFCVFVCYFHNSLVGSYFLTLFLFLSILLSHKCVDSHESRIRLQSWIWWLYIPVKSAENQLCVWHETFRQAHLMFLYYFIFPLFYFPLLFVTFVIKLIIIVFTIQPFMW